MCRAGLRVEVFDGSGKERLGLGTMMGFVDVYIIRGEDGHLYSSDDAEKKPKGFPGKIIDKIKGNPKIQLDDGRIVYGCQTWWKEIEEEKK